MARASPTTNANGTTNKKNVRHPSKKRRLRCLPRPRLLLGVVGLLVSMGYWTDQKQQAETLLRFLNFRDSIVRSSTISYNTANTNVQAETDISKQDLLPESTPHKEATTQQQDLRIAIYMTTHLSDQHIEFLEKCWPAMVQSLPLLRAADLIVYTSDTEHDNLLRNLGFGNVTIYRYDSPTLPHVKVHLQSDELKLKIRRKKQDGAVRAMVDPFLPHHQWFQGYDWVLRLNPDVIIKRDQWLVRHLHNSSIDGIFLEWEPGRSFYTDFYAFRPTAANVTALLQTYQKQVQQDQIHAETHIFPGFAHLLSAGRVVPLPHVERQPNVARILGAKADVVHDHTLVRRCPYHGRTKGTVTPKKKKKANAKVPTAKRLVKRSQQPATKKDLAKNF